MHSRKKTPVAVLRHILGLTVEEFASLIGKSISAVTSLETGRLGLSEETACEIARETGVSVAWLLDGNAKQKPYVVADPNGPRKKYTREEFEKIQAAKSAGPPKLPNELKLIFAFDPIGPWLSVFYKAAETGQADLARWLMRKAITEMAERFGRDDEAALQGTEKVRIALGDKEYMFATAFGRLSFVSFNEDRDALDDGSGITKETIEFL